MRQNRITWILLFLVGIFSITESFAQPKRPEPRYEVRVEKRIMMPMRDGVKLSTDLYFPEGTTEKLPVILMRTPYDKNTRYGEMWGRIFAGQGFVVAAQDMRGKFESEGHYTMSKDDVTDGYDTVEWLASQPWCNGKVGTYGCSYLGECQMMTARSRPPHLACMIPQAAGGANVDRGFGIYVGGVLTLSSAFRWFYDYGSLENPRPQTPKKDLYQIMGSLPVLDMMKTAEGPPTDWETVVSHPPGDAYWYDRGYVRETDRFDTPALHVNSWYDYGVHQSLYQFNLMRRNGITNRGRDHQYILISPTTHCASEYTCRENTIVGEREVGDARFDFLGLYLRWYEYWLKGVENGVTQTPKVQYYTMGKNTWVSAEEWPLQTTEFVKYYLHSDGKANTRHGSGALSPAIPDEEPSDRFAYDPDHPVPTVGGPSFDTVSAQGTPGAYDQSEVEEREDVLVYSTPVLEKGIEVTGPIELVLYVSTSVKDTDFTGKLVDVYPDGKAYNVQEGILRTRFRDGWTHPVFMEPGEVYEIRFPLESTSNFFGPGHRIRLEVSGSNFPGYARNMNTGGENYDESEWIVAKNTVYHSARYPSHLVLPIIPDSE